MRNYMTRNQYERHRKAIEECEEKLSIARKKVGAAAAHGDLSENAEYDAAVEESGFLAGRVEELKSLAVGVDIVDPKRTVAGVVTLGKTVTIENADSSEKRTVHLVGNGTLDTDAGEVSYIAPLGAALIGKREGDLAIVKLPAGESRFKVLSIEITEEAE